MNDLKSVLKEGKKLLAAGHHEKAKEILQSALDSGENDYMLLCLAALAYANLKEEEEAKEMYEKAIELDKQTPTAWQGLYKLYSSQAITVDKKAIEAVDILLSSSEGEKRNALLASRRQFLEKLGLYSILSDEDLKADSQLSIRIVNELMRDDRELKEEDKENCNRCFTILQESMNEHLYLLRAKFLRKSCFFSSWSPSLFIPQLEKCSDEWLSNSRLDAMAISFVVSGDIPEEWQKFIHQDCDSPLSQLLNAIVDEDWTQAGQLVDSNSSSCVPFTLASLRVLMRDESLEKLLQLVNNIKQKDAMTDSEVLSAVRSLKAEALFRMGKNGEATSLLPLLKPHFGLIDARIRIANGDEVPIDIVQSLDEEDRMRVDTWRLLKENRKEEARVKASQLEREQWEDLILKAECSPPDVAASFLVKAARVNGRCSRAFFLLASIMRGKAPAKACALAERAAMIRGDNGEYAQLADELKGETGGSNEERIKGLERLSLNCESLPLWAVFSLSRLLLQSGRPSDALPYLQKSLREGDSAIGWALLGEVYSARGQLLSAVGAYERSVQLEERTEWIVPMTQVLLRLGEYTRVVEVSEEWMKKCEEKGDDKMIGPLLLVLIQARLAQADDELSLVPLLFPPLIRLVSISPSLSITNKLAGDALVLLCRCCSSIFSMANLPHEWEVNDVKSALKTSSLFYSRAISIKKDDPSLWFHLALSLVMRANEGEKDCLQKARCCVIHSLELSNGRKGPWKCRLWTLLADIEDSLGSSPSRVQHCLSRALQLDSRNDETWLRLALLYIKCAQNELAVECIEKATKWNPLLSEAWAVMAELRLVQGDVEAFAQAEDLFRHSLTLKPTVWAMSRYTELVSTRISSKKTYSFDPSRLLIDMEKVLKLREGNGMNGPIVLSRLALLSELFGYLNEAMKIHKELPNSIHKERVELKCGLFEGTSHSSLGPLRKLEEEKTQVLRDMLTSRGMELDPSVEVEGGNEEEKKIEEVEVEGEKSEQPKIKKEKKYKCLQGNVSIPLLVSSIITFQKDMPESFVGSLHDVRPRHEIVDFFPTIVPEEVDNGIRYVEQDGEEPFRFRHKMAKELVEILQKKREEVVGKMI